MKVLIDAGPSEPSENDHLNDVVRMWEVILHLRDVIRFIIVLRLFSFFSCFQLPPSPYTTV